MWRLRVWFEDYIWYRLFPMDETPRIVMTGSELKAARQKLKLSAGAMSKLLFATVAQYQKWEKNGLHGPHDEEGPASVLVSMLVRLKEMQELLGYHGPIQ